MNEYLVVIDVLSEEFSVKNPQFSIWVWSSEGVGISSDHKEALGATKSGGYPASDEPGGH